MMKNISRTTGNGRGRDWWKTTNHMLNRSKQSSVLIDYQPEEINRHFADICTDDAYTLPPCYPVDGAPPQVSSHYVYRLLKSVKDTAVGSDGIPAWVFRENAHNLTFVMQHIINTSLSTGVYPACLKVSRIIPLPKKSKVESIDDLRPIAVTPIISRIIERAIINTHIREVYERDISKRQHGFRKHGSTSNAIIRIQNDCQEFRSQGFDHARIVSLDFSKAFDKVRHSTLIERLRAKNLSPYLVNWIAGFLSGRSQYTQIGSQKSSNALINLGVIQGSCGGPFYFNYYSDEMVKDDQHTSHSGFADDTSILLAGLLSQNDNSVCKLAEITQWCAESNLRLNPSKCKELLVKFRPCQVPPLPTIPRVSTLRLLGIDIDENLQFSTHVTSVRSRCTQIIYQINRLRRFGYQQSDLRYLYRTLVKPILTYGITVWGGSQQYNLQKLDCVSRVAQRLDIIDDFIPVKEAVKFHDQKLFNKISGDEEHVLRDLIPERSEYASMSLRHRNPPTRRGLLQNTSIFPDRYLKNF